MFDNLFDDLCDIAKDSIDIVSTPIKIGAKVTREITKPIAKAAKNIEEDVSGFFDD